MHVATFNINNINKRLDNLLAWLAKAEPDVVSEGRSSCDSITFFCYRHRCRTVDRWWYQPMGSREPNASDQAPRRGWIILDLLACINYNFSFRHPIPPVARARYWLASALPPLYDLPERRADLTPRLAGCDAAIIFGLQCRLLSVGQSPTAQVQVSDLWRTSFDLRFWFARLLCVRLESMIAATVWMEFLHRCITLRWIVLFDQGMIQFSVPDCSVVLR